MCTVTGMSFFASTVKFGRVMVGASLFWFSWAATGAAAARQQATKKSMVSESEKMRGRIKDGYV